LNGISGAAHTQTDVPPEPVGVPETFHKHVSLTFDLLALAWQADLTRVFTFMMAREVSQRTFPSLASPNRIMRFRATAIGRNRSRITRK
jgi:hypothetical protein